MFLNATGDGINSISSPHPLRILQKIFQKLTLSMLRQQRIDQLED
jgi:hypothetical protein